MKKEAARFFPLVLVCVAAASCTGTLGDGRGGLSPADEPGADRDPTAGAVPVDSPRAKLAAPSVARRLSLREYNNVVAALIYDSTRPFAFSQDARTPFDNESNATLNGGQLASTGLVDHIEVMAIDAATRLLADKARTGRLMASIGCMPRSASDRACFEQFLKVFGRRALRRPLTSANVAAYMGLFAAAEEDNDFYSAVALAVRMFLQSPELIYRIESDASHPVSGQPGVFQLNGHEMASRLSFLIWGEGPDDGLLDQAAAGKLDDPRSIREVAARMLADGRARNTVAAFHAMWLNYETLQGVAPPLVTALRTQTKALIGRVIFDEQRVWQDLLRSDLTYVNYNLASHYKVTVPPGSPVKSGSNRYDWLKWTGDGRMGLLSEGSFLSLAGTTEEEQMVIRRGKHVRERLLCQRLPGKPAAVDSKVTPTSPCKWDVMAAHRTGSCAGCHNQMDPVGFGLDAYDFQGAPRTHDKVDGFIQQKFPNLKVGDVLTQCPVHSEGALDPKDPSTRFVGPGQLAQLLLRSPEVGACLGQQVYSFATGRSQLNDDDRQFLADVLAQTGGGDFRLGDLITRLVSDDAFRTRRQSN